MSLRSNNIIKFASFIPLAFVIVYKFGVDILFQNLSFRLSTQYTRACAHEPIVRVAFCAVVFFVSIFFFGYNLDWFSKTIQPAEKKRKRFFLCKQ